MSKVTVLPLGEERYFKVSFLGHFCSDHANNLLAALKSHGIDEVERISMIWDCTEMRGYDSDARDIWQDFFNEIKSRIDVVHLISDNIAYRTAARALGIYWRVKMSVWSDYSQFESEIQ